MTPLSSDHDAHGTPPGPERRAPIARTSSPLVVLKFGSSFLREAADLPRAVRAIQRRRRAGRRVLAVVSALGDTTDRLIERARALSERPAPRDLARLLAGGEREAAALLALALEHAGVAAETLEPSDGCVRAHGALLDATDVTIDRLAFDRAFGRADVCVLPGFFARHDATDGVCLLGRGGSDLTAVVCGRALDAERCLLLKDVDGIFERDPADAAHGSGPRRFAELSYVDAAALEGTIVQPKALAEARRHGYVLEVGGDGAVEPTRVGARRTRFDPDRLVSERTRAESRRARA